MTNTQYTNNEFSKLPGALCEQCSLCNHPLVPPSGSTDGVVFIIGEAPGQEEAIKGAPFVGPSGVLLDFALNKAGVSTNDVYKTNIVMCKPPNNREPLPEEIAACMPRLALELNASNSPVLALGKVATEALEMDQYGRGEIFDWYGRKAMHTYHPAYILRKPSDSPIFTGDVDKFIGKPVYFNPDWENPQVIHITDPLGLQMVVDKIPDGEWVAFDIETDNVKWYKSLDGTPPDPILMLQVAWEAYGSIHNFVIDDVMLYDTPEVMPILQSLFDRVRTVAHNGKFDMVFLRSHIGLHMSLEFDTMLAHAVLDENAKHGLKELCHRYFGMEDYEERLIKQYLRTRNDRYSKIPFEPLAKYGVIDVIMTLQLKKIFEKKLIEQDRLDWPFRNILMRAANAFVEVELRGIKIDVPYLQEVQRFLEVQMKESAYAAMQSVGVTDLNMNSTQQVAHIVYDVLKMPPPKSRKIGPRSTNHEAIEPLAGKHPFIDHLLTHRRVAKMKSSYADNLLEAVDYYGRVHATFVLQGTEVGRLSARNPALQTIPRPEEEKEGRGMYGRLIRGAFIAEPGKILLIVDYSQAELRVAAVQAHEPFLIGVYAHGRDLHSEVAKAMYGDGYTKEQRVRCKMFNFSYLYGGSEYSFARDAGLPIHVAQQFVKDYNKVMPKLAEYRKTQFQHLADHGYVQSPFGRRRNFELITEINLDDAKKACVHAPIAGTASDLTLMSACELEEQGYNVVLTVHDSVVLEIPIQDADYITELARDVMEGMGRKYLPEVAWKSDPEVRLRWSDPPEEFLVR